MGLPDPQRSRVVLIGTSKYADEKLPDLPVVEKTVAALGKRRLPIRHMAWFLKAIVLC